MVKFGVIKSKIEKILVESYTDKTFKYELKNFKNNVLNNKNISQIYYLYDEIKSKKGLNESYASEYINECITIYENTINKISPKTFSEINSWVGHIKTTNDYSNVDNLFSTGLLQLEDKIKSKKVICENLQKTETKQEKEVINVPLNSMLSVANKTVKSYVSSLNEEEQKEVYEILSTPKEKLIESYNDLKEVVLEKLENQKSQSDQETKQTIDQVVNKLTTESFNELNYFKLKTLSEGL